MHSFSLWTRSIAHTEHDMLPIKGKISSGGIFQNPKCITAVLCSCIQFRYCTSNDDIVHQTLFCWMCHKRFPGQKATLCIVQENVNKAKQDRKFWDLSSLMDWIVKFLKMNYVNKLSVWACARRPAARWISMESTLHCKETLWFPCTCDLTESQWMQIQDCKAALQQIEFNHPHWPN